MTNNDIDMLINTLNTLTVCGEENMVKVVGMIQFLRGHKTEEGQENVQD